MNWTPRVDIPSDHPATGGQAGVGFAWNVRLRDALPAGMHTVHLTAVFANGQRVTLKGATTDVPTVVIQEIKRRHWRALALVLLSVMVIVYALRRWGSEGLAWQQRWLDGNRMAWGIGAVFVLLVATGVTGSSMGVLFNSPYGESVLEVQGASRTLLGDEGVRGDEWGVQLPNLLAQLHHEPRFPVINGLLGEGGQNMGVIGMTGVPVQQWAALARPATWGYFVLPLRQAMAWHWQLPFWGCLLALWWMLNVLRPAQRGLNLALSLAFCLAPYAAAWSNWPLYATLFPALAFVVATYLLRCTGFWMGAVLGAVLGWLLACWCLVLYPAWIIVVGSAMAFIGLGWWADNRERIRFGSVQLVALVVSAAILGALLGSWWLDTKDAIALMRATVYPGGRGAMPGGDLGWWWHLRGYHGMESLRTTGLDSNPSEASSYVILPLLMLALVAVSFVRDRQMRGTLLGCAVFMGCYWAYTLMGIPIDLARITLWGNMPVTRMDVGFGLVTAVLFCLYAPSAVVPASWGWRVAAIALALLSAGMVVLTLSHTPLSFVPNAGSPILIGAMAVAAAFICGWALWGRMGSAVALMLVVYLLAVVQFNPLRIAPAEVELMQGHRPYATDTEGRSQRTLVLNGDGIGAMTFAAVGIPIANGVFYYPHRAMWARMNLPRAEWPQVNRYQHLGFYLMDDVETVSGYRLVLGSVDQVHVHVNPWRFDFSCTGAARVVAPVQWLDALARNPGLTRLGVYRNIGWFEVQPSCPLVPVSAH
ncbi:MAG: hypothetical protein LCH71_01805 [Proteobacteria bacterium]|nr:hypothetical protein [Pseudomonadota bacterium]